MGDGSFDEWVSSSGTALKRLALLLTGNGPDADDLVQDALVKVLVKWGRVSAADNPDAYSRRILINEYIAKRRRTLRRNARRSLLVEPAVAHLEPAIVERSSLAGALARLGARQRAVLVLRYYCDLPDDEIAELLDCSRATVRSQAMRGLERLRTSGLIGSDEPADTPARRGTGRGT